MSVAFWCDDLGAEDCGKRYAVVADNGKICYFLAEHIGLVS